jgi:hypothetical protein
MEQSKASCKWAVPVKTAARFPEDACNQESRCLENIGGSSFFLIKGVYFKTVYGILGTDTRNLPGGQILPGVLLI